MPDDEEPGSGIDEDDPNIVVLTVRYAEMPGGWKTDEDDRQADSAA